MQKRENPLAVILQDLGFGPFSDNSEEFQALASPFNENPLFAAQWRSHPLGTENRWDSLTGARCACFCLHARAPHFPSCCQVCFPENSLLGIWQGPPPPVSNQGSPLTWLSPTPFAEILSENATKQRPSQPAVVALNMSASQDPLLNVGSEAPIAYQVIFSNLLTSQCEAGFATLS